MHNKSNKSNLLDLRVKQYQARFKKESEQTVTAPGPLRAELLEALAKRLSHTSSLSQPAGRVKTSPTGHKYIAIF